MPELPEVETIRSQLDKVLSGQRIIKIAKLHQKSLQGPTLKVVGRKIVAVKRKAKMIWIDLEGDLNLLIHLKMTGQLIYLPASASPQALQAGNFQNKHTRVVFELSRGRLIFNDLRLFGWIKIVSNQQLKDLFDKLPPDVVDKAFTLNYFKTILKNSRRAIKLVLLDQQKLGGVGNIYANDALFCAAVNPVTPARKVTRTKELHRCLQQVINRGIKYGGSTASDENYVNALGEKGRYQTKFLIYEQQGKKCRRCGGEIQKIKLGGRGTYFCPDCQK